MPRTLLVVPCYNEAARLDPDAFRRLVAAHPDVAVLLVNDGSTDGTGPLLDALAADPSGRLSALHLDRNRGKAEAVRLGLLEAARRGAAYAGYWDADLATPLDALPEFLALLDADPAIDIVLGSRVQLLGRHIRRRPLRHYLGRLFATAVSLVLGVPVYDTQCGAKLFRMNPTLTGLLSTPFRSRWIFDVEILARYLQATGRAAAGDRIHELPLRRWSDVAGSKLRPSSFVRAAFELAAIARDYRRRRNPR
jgi:glycosyltransferase involved in cell wall biosynthesis